MLGMIRFGDDDDGDDLSHQKLKGVLQDTK